MTQDTLPTPRTPHSEHVNELAAALAKAQASIQHASKDATNPHFSKKYADLQAIYNASRAALAENGLSVVQLTEFEPSGHINLVTTLLHASGQWMKSWYPVRPVKNDPQGLGSAMTYARRYSYTAMVGVASIGEDDDGNEGSGLNGKDRRDDSPQQPAAFENDALRIVFTDTLKRDFQKCKSVSELMEASAKNKPQLDRMGASSHGSDVAAANALRAEFKDCLKILEAAEKAAPPRTVEGALNPVALPQSVADDEIPF